MSFHRPRLGDSTFSGAPFNPRPGTLSPAERHSSTATVPANPVTDPTAATDRQADLVYLSDIEHRPVEWVWQDRLASGTLAMLSGDPGSGKTWVALAIAAALSRGRVPSNPVPFTGDTREPCTILYASTGNEAAELVRPRFARLDGDPARLVLLRGVLSAGFMQSTSLSLRDTPMLEDALERTQARLLIIDPLHSYLFAVDRHRANESGRAFDNLARLAEKHHCCILLCAIFASAAPGRPPSSSPAQSAPSSWPGVAPMRPPGPPWCR